MHMVTMVAVEIAYILIALYREDAHPRSVARPCVTDNKVDA